MSARPLVPYSSRSSEWDQPRCRSSRYVSAGHFRSGRRREPGMRRSRVEPHVDILAQSTGRDPRQETAERAPWRPLTVPGVRPFADEGEGERRRATPHLGRSSVPGASWRSALRKRLHPIGTPRRRADATPPGQTVGDRAVEPVLPGRRIRRSSRRSPSARGCVACPARSCPRRRDRGHNG